MCNKRDKETREGEMSQLQKYQCQNKKFKGPLEREYPGSWLIYFIQWLHDCCGMSTIYCANNFGHVNAYAFV